METRNLTLQHGYLRCRIEGEGPTLLLLHTAWGDAEFSWSRVWTELAKHFRVLAPDLPGFGGSAALDHPSPAAFNEVWDELLASQGVTHAVVVGSSFSAFLALHFADAHPDRVTRLVMVNGAEFPVLPPWARRLFGKPRVHDALSWFWSRTMLTSEWTVRSAFSPRGDLPPGFLAQITKNPKARAHAAVLTRTWLNHTAAARVPRMPLALIWGTEDRLLPLKRAMAIRSWAPGSRLLTIERAGHMPQVEQSAEFVRALLSVAQA